MSTITQQWNPWQKELSRLLSSPDGFDEAMSLCLRMHNEVNDFRKGISPTIFQSLLDFWKNKTIAGLLTMPITRHQIVHINDCFKLKERYQKNAAR